MILLGLVVTFWILFFVIQNLVLRHTFRFLGFLSAVKRDLIRDQNLCLKSVHVCRKLILRFVGNENDLHPACVTVNYIKLVFLVGWQCSLVCFEEFSVNIIGFCGF